MSDFNSLVNEQLARPGVARAYHHLAPFYRLADQLILLRKKRGLSQQELAAKAQTTQAVVSRLENVSVRCSLETVVRLAEALDAVVEVRLTPLEQLRGADSASQEYALDGEGCNDDLAQQADKGAVYFGNAAQKPCQSLVWFNVDPRTQRVFPAKVGHKSRTPEIA